MKILFLNKIFTLKPFHKNSHKSTRFVQQSQPKPLNLTEAKNTDQFDIPSNSASNSKIEKKSMSFTKKNTCHNKTLNTFYKILFK